jgi:anti-sigma B factor antagonist
VTPGGDGLAIEVIEVDDAAVVSLSGDLDLATAPRLRDELLRLSNRGTRAVMVDLAQLEFIDSSGLGVLVSAMRRFREHGGDLALQSPKPAAHKILEMTGLTKVFSIS